MQVNSRVQEIWLRLLDAVDSSQTPRVERTDCCEQSILNLEVTHD